MIKEERIREILKITGVLQTGHFLLSSGRHADKYLQCAKVLQYPGYANELAVGIEELWQDEKIDVVIGPAIGGIIVSYAVGQSMGVRSLFTERDKQGQMQLRRNFAINSNEKVLVVEDVVTTGGSVKEVIELLETMHVKIAGISSLIDRSNGKVDFNYKYKPLLSLDVTSYTPELCPLCKDGLPLIKPGSKKDIN